MLGILAGTDEGLLEIVPGEEPRLTLDGLRVTSLDYRDGMALAGIAGRGVWVHRGRRWEPTWEGDPSCVRVGLDGLLYIGADPAALYASHDEGLHWEELGGLRGVLAYRPHDATGDQGRRNGGRPHVGGIAFTADGLLVGVAGAGAWFSRDGGSTWLRRGDGLDPSLRGLWEHPEQRDRLFACTGAGFFRSDDGGYLWVQSLSGLDRSWAGSAAVLPATPDVLMLAAARREPGLEGALFRSANGGVSWKRTQLGERYEWEQVPLVSRLWDSPDTVFAFAGGVVWGSHDAGQSWMALAEGLPQAHALTAAL